MRYAQHRDSGVEWVGAIPADWDVIPFFAAVKQRRDDNAGLKEQNLLSLSFGRIVAKDIDSSDGLLPESFETYQVIQPSDVVFRLTDLQNDKRSLRSAIVRERGIITSAYLAVTPIRHDPNYFAYLMRAYDSQKVFYSMGGGLRQSMKFEDMKHLPVLLPTFPVQRQIVDYLDAQTAKIDELVEKQERLIETLSERRQAVISHAVTKGLDVSAPASDIRSDLLGRVPRHWKVWPLKWLISRIDQGVSPLASAELADETSWGVLKSGCVNHGVFSELQHKRLPADFKFDPTIEVKVGDLLVSRASGSPSLVGSAAIVRALKYRLILSDKIFRLRVLPDHDPDFLEWFMNSRPFREQVAGAISGAEGLANNLPSSSLRRFEFPVPPLKEQHAVGAYLRHEAAKIDALTSKAREMIDVLKERRQALIGAAVTGKIDVRGLV